MSKRIQARATVQVENEFAKVTEWRFAPGTETGHHRHGFNYVVVPMTNGRLLVETAEGEKHRVLETGASYAGNAGVTHNVVNAGDGEVVFVEIELLRDRE